MKKGIKILIIVLAAAGTNFGLHAAFGHHGHYGMGHHCNHHMTSTNNHGHANPWNCNKGE